MTLTASQPSPIAFMQALNGYQTTGALKGALELDLFTRIAEGHRTAPQLAGRIGASPKGVRVLTDFLTVLGFLTKSGEGDTAEYALTLDSATFLDSRTPSYLGGCAQFLTGRTLVSAFDDLAQAVRRGGTMLPGQGTVEPENPVWVDFARGMMPMMFPAAEAMAELLATGLQGRAAPRVLDVAAGHGLFGILLAQRAPQARVTALDWPAVLEVAQENARRFGVAERYATRAGSAFELDFDHGWDLVLLTNFLHHFDVPTCESLLRKVHAALAPGGRVAILEFVPNDDRVTPPVPAAFALVMLASTLNGDAYTHGELASMCRRAGFAQTELHPAGASPQSIVVAMK